MKKFSFNEGTLSFNNNIVTYEIPLDRTNINSIEEIKFIREIPFMFPITNLELTQNKMFFLMEIEVENGFIPLGAFKSNSTDEEKYLVIEKLCEIGMELKNLEKLVTVLDDINILVNSNQEVKLLYRGVQGLMPSASYNDEDIETQIKRAALFILTGAKFDEIRVNGLEAALSKSSQERYKLVSKIAQAKSLNNILMLLEGLKDERELPIIKKPTKSIFSKVIRKDTEEKVSKIDKPKKEKKSKPVIEKKPPKEKKKIKERIAASQGNFVEDTKTFFAADKSKLKVIAGIFVGLALIIIVIGLFSKGEPANTTLAESEKDEDILIEGLQYAAIQNYEDASQKFDKMKTSFNEFEKDTQRAILFSYLMAGKYQEAIDAEPKFSYSVINYLISKENLEIVKNIDSDEPVIMFEKAAINQEFKTVLEYKDNVKLDGRRESLVVDAYIGLNEFDKAMEFAKSKGNTDLITKIENKKNEIENKKREKVKKEQEEKKAKDKKETDKKETDKA